MTSDESSDDDVVETVRKTNQQVLESVRRSNEEVLEQVRRNNPDAADGVLRSNREVLESVQRSNDEILEKVRRSNQDVLNAVLSHNADALVLAENYSKYVFNDIPIGGKKASTVGNQTDLDFSKKHEIVKKDQPINKEQPMCKTETRLKEQPIRTEQPTREVQRFKKAPLVNKDPQVKKEQLIKKHPPFRRARKNSYTVAMEMQQRNNQQQSSNGKQGSQLSGGNRRPRPNQMPSSTHSYVHPNSPTGIGKTPLQRANNPPKSQSNAVVGSRPDHFAPAETSLIWDGSEETSNSHGSAEKSASLDAVDSFDAAIEQLVRKITAIIEDDEDEAFAAACSNFDPNQSSTSGDHTRVTFHIPSTFDDEVQRDDVTVTSQSDRDDVMSTSHSDREDGTASYTRVGDDVFVTPARDDSDVIISPPPYDVAIADDPSDSRI